jgi:general secretion pathway protein B
MSFILDALRKSETQRQREAAPSLSHAPIATIRRETPVWTWLIIVLLALALAAFSLAWWRGRPLPLPAEVPDVRTQAMQEALRAPQMPAAGPEATDSARAPAVTATQTPRPIRDLAALDPALPAYRLEFVAFKPADPADSSAWINGRLYRIGERVANGPEIIEIRADSVILAHLGERFLLR